MDEMEEKEARLEEGREGRGVGRRGDATRLGFRAEGEGENTCIKNKHQNKKHQNQCKSIGKHLKLR